MSWNDILQKLICVACCSDCCNYTAFICTACTIFFAPYFLGLVREFNESFTAIDETQQGIWVLLNKIQSPLDCVAVLIRNAKLLRHFLLLMHREDWQPLKSICFTPVGTLGLRENYEVSLLNRTRDGSLTKTCCFYWEAPNVWQTHVCTTQPNKQMKYFQSWKNVTF